MGWAKYMEDNYDFIEERRVQYRRNAFIMPTVFVMEPSEGWGLAAPTMTMSQKVDNCMPCSEKKKEYADKILCCQSCGCDFRYHAEQQAKYDKKGWQPPKRCKKCRKLANKKQLEKGQHQAVPAVSFGVVTWVA